jgi:hypothetical protein
MAPLFTSDLNPSRQLQGLDLPGHLWIIRMKCILP